METQNEDGWHNLFSVMRRSNHDTNSPAIEPLAAKASQYAYPEQDRVQNRSSIQKNEAKSNKIIVLSYDVLKPAVP